jgi:magnesium chelatase family protein
VLAARQVQRARFGNGGALRLNRDLEGRLLHDHCALDEEGEGLLEAALQRFCLSARGRDRVLRVSRTIADLCNSPVIGSDHVAEALQYRFTFA